MFEGLPDHELWSRAGNHDGNAFAALFERHGLAVYNHCFRCTASWSKAEELTSTVFLQAWRQRRRAQLHTESILPWLLAIANNVVRDAERSSRRYRRLLARVPPLPAFSFDDEAASRLDDERLMAGVPDVVRQLRPEEQEVIALCDWAGLSQAEAAAALGVPPGTVRSRLARAHQRIRGQMQPIPTPSEEVAAATHCYQEEHR